MNLVLHRHGDQEPKSKPLITRDGSKHWKLYFPGFASVVRVPSFAFACEIARLLKGSE